MMERIDGKLKELGISAKKMAADIGFSDSLISQWRKGTEPSASKLLKVAEYLQCSVEYLLTGDNPTISDEDSKIIALYNKAEPLAKDIAILALERGQRQPSAPARVPTPRKVKDGQTQNGPAERPICIYNTPVAAGVARADLTDEYEFVRGGEEVPPNANYGVRVDGNSMEPDIPDGYVVWVRAQSDLENGEIGIFRIDQEHTYVKKLYRSGKRQELRSINPEYDPITKRFVILGKVLTWSPDIY